MRTVILYAIWFLGGAALVAFLAYLAVKFLVLFVRFLPYAVIVSGVAVIVITLILIAYQKLQGSPFVASDAYVFAIACVVGFLLIRLGQFAVERRQLLTAQARQNPFTG